MRGTESVMIARANYALFMSRWTVTLVTISFATACVGKNEVTPERCTDLRDHVVELQLSTLKNINSRPSIPTVGSDRREAPAPLPIDIAGHREALNQALGETFADNCLKRVSADQLTCALGASDAEAVDRCLSTSK